MNLTENYKAPSIIIFSHKGFKEMLNGFYKHCKEHPESKMEYSNWRYIKGYADDSSYSRDVFIYSTFVYPSGKINSTIEVIGKENTLINTFLMNEGFTDWINSNSMINFGYYVRPEELTTFASYKDSAPMAATAMEIMKNSNTAFPVANKLLNTSISYNLNDLMAIDDTITTNTITACNLDGNNSSITIKDTVSEVSQLKETIGNCSTAIKKASGDFCSVYNVIDNLANALDNTSNDNNKKNCKNDKEKYGMKFNFDFGPCASDSVRLSIYGIAVKNPSGTWVAYDRANKNIMDVDVLNFDGRDMMYKIPVAIKDISAGDCLIHNRLPMIVTGVYGNSIAVVDVMNGEAKNILPTKSPFGFDFYTKVVSLIDGLNTSASADSPFGNLLPLLMMSSDGNTFNVGGDCELSPVMMYLAMSGNLDMSDPLMAMALFGGFGSGNNMGMMLYLMNQNKQKSIADNAPVEVVK